MSLVGANHYCAPKHPLGIRPCEWCHEDMAYGHSDRRFCSPRCQHAHRMATNPEYYTKQLAAAAKAHIRRRLALRKRVFSHYGTACACCGESTDEFLCIDHINGGGSAHRRSIGKSNIYRWLEVNNFPEGFQILCWNCNSAKGLYGICPHQK